MSEWVINGGAGDEEDCQKEGGDRGHTKADLSEWGPLKVDARGGGRTARRDGEPGGAQSLELVEFGVSRCKGLSWVSVCKACLAWGVCRGGRELGQGLVVCF